MAGKPKNASLKPVAVLDEDAFAVVYNCSALGIATALNDTAGVEALKPITMAVLAGFGQERLDALLLRLERLGETAFPSMARGDGVNLQSD